MHRQVNALVSAGGSPGKVAHFGNALGEAGLDIEAIGGAEWKHDGPLCLVLREDNQDARDRSETVCDQPQVPWLSFATSASSPPTRPWWPGGAAAAIANSSTSTASLSASRRKAGGGRHGFRPADADDAVSRLTDAGSPRTASIIRTSPTTPT